MHFSNVCPSTSNCVCIHPKSSLVVETVDNNKSRDTGKRSQSNIVLLTDYHFNNLTGIFLLGLAGVVIVNGEFF